MLAAIFRFGLHALHKPSWGRAPARLQYLGGYEQLQENGSNLQQTPIVFCCIYHSSSKHSFKSKGENPALTYILTQSFNKAVMGIFNTHRPYENTSHNSYKLEPWEATRMRNFADYFTLQCKRLGQKLGFLYFNEQKRFTSTLIASSIVNVFNGLIYLQYAS